ncbi:MAG: glycosyltransferase family 4 protein [Candidatus Niyogibacteria bacterium]|nr:glycosyltransferase family 4 protein [Candidatus Niyogibacteria bacterium]
MKKILFCITKSGWGGAQRYVYDLATRLPAEFEPVVALGGFGILLDKLNDRKVRTIPIERLGRDIRMGSDISVFFELIRIFRRERPDIVHLNSSKMAFLGAPAARLAGIPLVVFTAHGWPFNEERPRWQRTALRAALFFALLFPHRIIAVSQAVRNDIRRFPGATRKTAVIHNGIGPAAFLSREESRARLIEREARLARIPANAPWIGINAELHKSKGIVYAIQAAAILAKETPFVLCIISGGEEYEALKRQISDAGLAERVFLLGYVDAASRYLKAFDIFLLPSVTEALGYVLLEAGAAGLPVVASRVGGIPEIIEHEKTGLLVPPRDPEALERAMKFFIAHPDGARRIGENLRQKIASQFSLEKMAEQTLAVYRRSFRF